MKREILHTAKSDEDGNWYEGWFDYSDSDRPLIWFYKLDFHMTPVDPETVCRFSGKTLAKGQKIFEGTIAFHEEELNEGDHRTYVVCVFIDEWSMFAFLTIDEYLTYLEQGAESLDEVLFWTYSLTQSEKYHYAGNIFDNPELLSREINLPVSHEQV